jgi:hypothetical protein
MDPLTTLYARLHRQSRDAADSIPPPPEPPRLEDWLRYWDDDDTDLGNLRNYEHWLMRAMSSHPANR